MAKLSAQPWPSYQLNFGQKMAKLSALQHIYMYIYIYADGCLIENGPILVATFGVQLSTHEFCQFFGQFLGPLSSGGSVFLPCVLVPGAHEPQGGSALFFFWPNTGGTAFSAKFFYETQGADGREICCPLFFIMWVFWLFPVAAGHARKKKQKKKKKKKQKTKKEKKKKKKKQKNKKEEQEKEEEEEEQVGQGEGEQGEEEEEEEEEAEQKKKNKKNKKKTRNIKKKKKKWKKEKEHQKQKKEKHQFFTYTFCYCFLLFFFFFGLKPYFYSVFSQKCKI